MVPVTMLRETYAETLLNDDTKMLYAFVTDGVDGYLFVDVFKSP